MRTSAKLACVLCAALLAAGCGATATTSPTAPAATLQRVMTAEQITTAMQHQGFKTGTVTAYTAATDPNHLLGRQGGYTSKTEWNSPNDTFDTIEVYPTTADATKRTDELHALSGSMIGDGYDYQQGPAILRLSTVLTPKQAGLAYSDFLTALGI